jgi:hypothetical protein
VLFLKFQVPYPVYLLESSYICWIYNVHSFKLHLNGDRKTHTPTPSFWIVYELKSQDFINDP